VVTAPSGVWVPVGRGEAHQLLRESRLLRLYLVLRDQCSRASWRYGGGDDPIFYRGWSFEWIASRTYLFDLDELAKTLATSPDQLTSDLRLFASRDLLESLHLGMSFGPYGEGCCTETHGPPLSDFLSPWKDDGDRGWMPSAVRMAKPRSGYVPMPKEATQVEDGLMVFLVTLYLRARYRKSSFVDYRGRSYRLNRGEIIVSVSELAREFGVHRQQVKRWADYALRDGLLRRIPIGRDCRWQVVTYPQRSEPAGQGGV